MSVKIYSNPECKVCQQTIKDLEAQGTPVEVIYVTEEGSQ